MSSKAEKLEAFGRLLDIMDRLRAECPWDKKQTFESLRHLTIEETYELGDAILSGNRSEIKKELGDLLLHIVFYSKLGSEEGAFDIAEVAHEICEKLIYRHPHIYGDVKVKTYTCRFVLNTLRFDQGWKPLGNTTQNSFFTFFEF